MLAILGNDRLPLLPRFYCSSSLESRKKAAESSGHGLFTNLDTEKDHHLSVRSGAEKSAIDAKSWPTPQGFI
jgi:hypothetical protein